MPFSFAMPVTWRDFLHELLGLSTDAGDLTLSQMACRAFVVFCFAVALARAADRRVLGHNAGFDIMLLVILGSVLSRAINGQASFFPSLGASALLVLLHHLIATLAFRSHGFSQLLKGRAILLVRGGRVDEAGLRRAKITRDDLEESLRLNGVERIAEAADARLERNGSISVVKAKGRDAGGRQ